MAFVSFSKVTGACPPKFLLARLGSPQTAPASHQQIKPLRQAAFRLSFIFVINVELLDQDQRI